MPINLKDFKEKYKEIETQDLSNIMNLSNSIYTLYSSWLYTHMANFDQDETANDLSDAATKATSAKFVLTEEPWSTTEEVWEESIQKIKNVLALLTKPGTIRALAELSLNDEKEKEAVENVFKAAETLQRVYEFEVPLAEWKQKFEEEKVNIEDARNKKEKKDVDDVLERLARPESTDDIIQIEEHGETGETDENGETEDELDESQDELNESQINVLPEDVNKAILISDILSAETRDNLKRRGFLNFTSTDEHDALKKAYDKYAQSVKNHESEEKQDALLDELRIAAEQYVVLKRGTRWRGNENWRPTGTYIGTDRFDAAMSIIQKSREYFGMNAFDRKAHDTTKEILEETSAASKFDKKNKSVLENAKLIKEGLLKGDQRVRKFIQTLYVEADDLELDQCQGRILKCMAFGTKDTPKEDLRKIGEAVAKDISYVIAHATLTEEKRKANQPIDFDEDELKAKANTIRRTPAFLQIAKECITDWNKLVQHGVDAYKGTGQEVVLTFAKANKRYLDLKVKKQKKTGGKQLGEGNAEHKVLNNDSKKKVKK